MIEIVAKSDIGEMHKVNQDSYLISLEGQYCILADGMGGAAGGALASELAVTTISDFIQIADSSTNVSWPFGYDVHFSFEYNAITTAIRLANLKICRAAEENDFHLGMGSTVVVVWVRGDRAFWSHLGDSRLYLKRGTILQQLSEDHSLVQEQLKLGIITQEEAKTHTFRHIVTQALGSREISVVKVSEQSLQSGDMLLLTSDGLWDSLKSEQLLNLIQAEEHLDEICKDLIEAANTAGGNDNITAILLRYFESI
jgi:protein phosphatase